MCMGLIDTDLRSFQNISHWQSLISFSEELSKNPSYSEVIRTEEDYYKVSRDLEMESAILKGNFYEKVLIEGLKWVTEDALERCPICNSPINAEVQTQQILVTSCHITSKKTV